MSSQLATVEYQVGTYSGETYVNCDENDDNDFIVAMAKKRLYSSHGAPSMPMYYESWKVTDRRYL